MTELPTTSGTDRVACRTGAPLVALCLVLLQLVTALHFALVPHRFSAGVSGFVHVDAHAAQPAPSAQSAELVRGLGSPVLVAGSATCAGDSCPMGFAGYHSVFLGSSEASALLSFALQAPRAQSQHCLAERGRVLLSAPKTSPPV